MSLPPNIERFNQNAAKIFSLLYESFPVPRSIDVREIDIDAELSEATGELTPAGEVAHATFIWLEGSGYITFRKNMEVLFTECVLTAKGLEVLNAIPSSLSTSQTVGEFVSKAVKAGAAESVSSAVKFIFAKGIEYVPLVINTVSN